MKIRLHVPNKIGRGCFVFGEFNNSILESANEYVVICYDEFEKKNVFVGTDNKTRPRYNKLCKRLRLNIQN